MSITFKFPLGEIVITDGAHSALKECAISPLFLLFRHRQGNWGEISSEDQHENDRAVVEGNRVLSVYPLQDDLRIWIITEADRTVTTLLLPEEY